GAWHASIGLGSGPRVPQSLVLDILRAHVGGGTVKWGPDRRDRRRFRTRRWLARAGRVCGDSRFMAGDLDPHRVVDAVALASMGWRPNMRLKLTGAHK